MKTLLAMICLMPSFVFAQDMRDLEGLLPSIQTKYPQVYRILKLDDTNHQKYVMAKFTCNEFSLRLYFQRSARLLANAYDFPGFEKDTGVPFQQDKTTEKLQLFYVSLNHVPAGFYHAITAVLMHPERPELPSSYIFIEPQTDEVMQTLGEVYEHYSRYYGHIASSPLKIGINDVQSFKFSGKIYQSYTTSLQTFEFSPR